MSEENQQKVMNRWLVVVGALLIQLALGTIYCWGVTTGVVSPYIGEETTKTVYIFGVGLLSFAVVMISAGNIMAKIGAEKTAMLGGIVTGLGVILSAFMTTLGGMIFTYGIIFGAGIGLAYVCPIATAAKWFPDKKGLINGIAVAGFGMGAFIFNFIIKAISNPDGIAATIEVGGEKFQNPDYVDAITSNYKTLFIVLGIIYIIMIVGGATFLKNPPKGWLPEGYTPPPPKAGVSSGLQLTRPETIKTDSFKMIWLMFLLSAISGLMVLGSYKSFASSADPDTEALLYEIGTVDLVLLGSIMALFNGAGRIAWGKLADMLNYKKAMLIMFAIQGILMIAYFYSNGSAGAYWFISCAIIFCFGGNFSLFPTATADLFGSDNLGKNYGAVFSAYGIAGFLGATMVSAFVNAFGSYEALFIVMGIMSLASAVLSYIIKEPKAE
jgi:OFA family oxalate/formate antiporter-like MFS transporter